MKLLNKKSGFSFVELVVVVAIVGLLSLGVFVSFSGVNYIKNQTAAVLDFHYNLKKIQNYALTGKKNDLGKVPTGYGIYIESETVYWLFGDTSGDHIFSDDDTVIQRFEMPEGIKIAPSKGTITSIVPIGTFCFDDDNLDGSYDCFSEVTFNIIIEGSELSKKVMINNSTGQVTYEQI